MRLPFTSCVLLFALLLSGKTLANDEKNTLNNCQFTYKKCITKVIDRIDAFYEKYEHIYDQCVENIHTIADAEYQFVPCQDQLNICKQRNSSVSQKINNTKDISLVTGDPNKYGLNEVAIQTIKKQASAIPKLKSLLISRDNKLIFEEYYAFKDDSKPHHIYSVTKSVMSLLVGIAIDKNYLESEDRLIKEYFPAYFDKEIDPRKENISIKHVLSMTTGINFTDSNNWHDWSSFESFLRDDNAHDWILNREMLLNYQPGETWLYGTPNTDLLSSIIESVSKTSTLEFAEKYLFEPLDINNYAWLHDSSENYIGGFGLYLRPRALMRIGLMVQNGGIYKGKRVVSEKWINKSLSKHIGIGGEEGMEYGYLWWRFRVGSYQAISAFGYGGQLITMVPELNVVIVTTSDGYSACSVKTMEEQFDEVLNLVKRVILSLVEL